MYAYIFKYIRYEKMAKKEMILYTWYLGQLTWSVIRETVWYMLI